MAHRGELEEEAVVPDFRGRQALDAWLFGHDAGLLCQGPDPDSPQPLLHGRVVDQRPAPGTTVRRWDTVTVWVHDEPGDLVGVREPRRPLPLDRRDKAAERDR
jgi:beta-lactam-binding protein with PASTA domain